MSSPLWPGQQHSLGSRLVARLLRAAGWTALLATPPGPKFIAAAAPHTSNADFWPGLFWKWSTRIPLHFVAKRELFRFPLGVFMRAVGGVALDRRRAGGNFVDAVVSVIEREREIIMLVAPEGTRSGGQYWKTGFYFMALKAGLPIGVTILDWQRRRVGVIGYVTPTGDIEADFAEIRELLRDVRGRRPENEIEAYPPPAAPGDSDQPGLAPR
ncbi:1-acyl-sn-glycerol-3-phosphate acyltransferase [Deinococcus sp.]|uniref:1-acyl-sn-glycerol-3-phosphate acyltransferase n=1 Tax=Deinococcus sp. TaxID=47478 RepID=UPI0025C6D995|nr:1-acyl-sn-glycerol-3-phosphate acyltransferase [Deinococcus sp.]